MPIDLPIPFNRLFKGSIVEDQVFTTTVARDAYLTSPVRYAGMVVSLVEGGVSSLWQLNATEDAWVEAGGGGGSSQDTDYNYLVCTGIANASLVTGDSVQFVETKDPLNSWVSDTFTAPKTGLYHVDFSIELGLYQVALWYHKVNGVQNREIANPNARVHPGQSTVWLEKDDTWELVFSGATNTPVNNGNKSYMSIAMFPDSVLVDMSVGELNDVDTTTTLPLSGDVLTWDGSNFIPLAGGGSGTAIATTDKLRLTEALANGATTTWLGDSITEDVDGYVRHVESLFPTNTFTNRATGGHTSIDLVSTQLALGVADNAEVYILAFGLNDIRYFDGRGAVTIAAYLVNMKTATDALKATTNSPTIALVNIFPTSWKDQFTALHYKGQLDLTRQWNDELEAFCNREGVLYIDVHSPIFKAVNEFNYEDVYASDSVHPTSDTGTPALDTGALLYAEAFLNSHASCTSQEMIPAGKHFFKFVMYDHETAGAGGALGLENIGVDDVEHIGLSNSLSYNTTNLFGVTPTIGKAYYNTFNDFPFNMIFSTATYPASGIPVRSLYSGIGYARGPKSFSTYYSKNPEAMSDIDHESWELVAQELTNDGITLNILPPSRKGFYYRFKASGAGTLNMKRIGTPLTPVRVNQQNVLSSSKKYFIDLFGAGITNSADGLNGNLPNYMVTFESPYQLTELEIESFSGLTDFEIALSFDGAALSNYTHASWVPLVTGTTDGTISLTPEVATGGSEDYRIRKLQDFETDLPSTWFTQTPNTIVEDETVNVMDGSRSAVFKTNGSTVALDKIETPYYVFSDSVYFGKDLTFAFDFYADTATADSYRVEVIVWDGTSDIIVDDILISTINQGETFASTFFVGEDYEDVRIVIYPEIPNVANIFTMDNFRFELPLANGGSGGIGWGDPVDADIVPDGHNTRDMGTASASMNNIYAALNNYFANGLYSGSTGYSAIGGTNGSLLIGSATNNSLILISSSTHTNVAGLPTDKFVRIHGENGTFFTGGDVDFTNVSEVDFTGVTLTGLPTGGGTAFLSDGSEVNTGDTIDGKTIYSRTYHYTSGSYFIYHEVAIIPNIATIKIWDIKGQVEHSGVYIATSSLDLNSAFGWSINMISGSFIYDATGTSSIKVLKATVYYWYP